MSYASLAAPSFPVFQFPTRTVQRAVVLGLQSVGVAAALWLLLAAPGFLTDQTGLHTHAPIVAGR